MINNHFSAVQIMHLPLGRNPGAATFRRRESNRMKTITTAESTARLGNLQPTRKNSASPSIAPSGEPCARPKLVSWLQHKLLFKYHILRMDSDSEGEEGSDSFSSPSGEDATAEVRETKTARKGSRPERSEKASPGSTARKGKTIYGTSNDYIQTFRTPVTATPFYVVSIKRHSSKSVLQSRRVSRFRGSTNDLGQRRLPELDPVPPVREIKVVPLFSLVNTSGVRSATAAAAKTDRIRADLLKRPAHPLLQPKARKVPFAWGGGRKRSLVEEIELKFYKRQGDEQRAFIDRNADRRRRRRMTENNSPNGRRESRAGELDGLIAKCGSMMQEGAEMKRSVSSACYPIDILAALRGASTRQSGPRRRCSDRGRTLRLRTGESTAMRTDGECALPSAPGPRI